MGTELILPNTSYYGPCTRCTPVRFLGTKTILPPDEKEIFNVL